MRHRSIRSRTAVLAAVATVLVLAAVVTAVLLRDGDPTPPEATRPTSTSSLLALTWGPSLCTVEPANRGCRSGHVGRLGRVFVLHGLWPQPQTEQYCDVPPKGRGARPPVTLPEDLRSALQTRMSDASVLAPHEWYAHGTCSGVSATEYFRIAAGLADAAGAVLDPLFAGARGEVSARAVRAAIDGRFGAGAGRRVALSCRDGGRGGPVIYEVRLSLPAVAELRSAGQEPSLRDGLAAGPAVPPGCGRGRVP